MKMTAIEYGVDYQKKTKNKKKLKQNDQQKKKKQPQDNGKAFFMYCFNNNIFISFSGVLNLQIKKYNLSTSYRRYRDTSPGPAHKNTTFFDFQAFE